MIVSTRGYVTWKNPLTDYFSRCSLFLFLMSASDSSARDLAARWGPSPALAVGRGGATTQSDSTKRSTTGVLRGKSFVGFVNEAALNQVCGVATSDSNNNKSVDKKLDGICIKEDCKTPSHMNVKRSANFVPGWYLIRKDEKRVKDVHMFPRGEPALTTLHKRSLLNLVIKDRILAVTIFDRLEGATTTEKGQSVTRALSMDQGFRAGPPTSDDGASLEDDDEDLSYEGDQDEVTLMKVLKKPGNNIDEAQALKEAKKLIAELPLDPAVLSEQEATHLRILMTAAKAADISAEGSFVPPAIVTNLLKVTSTLLEVIESSSERQSQLGYQLEENLTSTTSLDKLVKKRTSKGSALPSEPSENIWRGLQGLMDRQLKQERRIKDLDSQLNASMSSVDEMKALLESKNVEVEAMRIGFRKTESLLLNRILDLEKDNNGLSHMDLIFKSPDFLLLKERVSCSRSA